MTYTLIWILSEGGKIMQKLKKKNMELMKQ